MISLLVAGGCAPTINAPLSPSSDDLQIAMAGLRAVAQEFGRPTTVMAPKFGDAVQQLASAVGAKESSREAGIRCVPSVTGPDCQLVEKGINVVVRSVRAEGEQRIAIYEINRQQGDEPMSSIIRRVFLGRVEGRWQVLRVEGGPLS